MGPNGETSGSHPRLPDVPGVVRGPVRSHLEYSIEAHLMDLTGPKLGECVEGYIRSSCCPGQPLPAGFSRILRPFADATHHDKPSVLSPICLPPWYLEQNPASPSMTGCHSSALTWKNKPYTIFKRLSTSPLPRPRHQRLPIHRSSHPRAATRQQLPRSSRCPALSTGMNSSSASFIAGSFPLQPPSSRMSQIRLKDV